MDKRATCRKILRKTALSVLAASILMTGTVDAVRAEETPNVLQTVEAESGTLLGKAKSLRRERACRDWSIPATGWK